MDEAANREARLRSDLDKLRVILREHEDTVLSTERETRRAQEVREAACLAPKNDKTKAESKVAGGSVRT